MEETQKRDSGVYVLAVKDPSTELWELGSYENRKDLNDAIVKIGGVKDKNYRLFVGAKERTVEEKVTVTYTF
jgi:hypothetical protein